MKTRIYKAQVSTPLGHFTFAVDSTEQDAKADIYNIVTSEMKCPVGMLRVKEVVKSNRRVLANMYPVKNATVDGKFWAWFIRE